jgi:2-dehydropantoate 2-reductase
MGQDMHKCRRTEIDFINGVIVQKGQEIGLPTPTHEKLIAAVKKVELGQATPSPEHVYAIHSAIR